MDGSSIPIYPLKEALAQMFMGLEAIYSDEVDALAGCIEANDKQGDIIGTAAIRGMILGFFLHTRADHLRSAGYEEELSSLVDRVLPTPYGEACIQLGRYFQEKLCDLSAAGESEVIFTDNDIDRFPQFPEEGIPADVMSEITAFRERVSDGF